MRTSMSWLKTLPQDIPAGIVVFLVAVPLCLGISLASGAPPLSGLIAGIIGGLVVALISGSHVSVSGPAAGLTVIVLGAIQAIGFEGMLLATALAGAMQLAFGYLRMGKIGAFVPSAVIKGMLTAIGLILILNQIPLALGLPQENAPGFTQPIAMLQHASPLAFSIALIALLILILWDTAFISRIKWLKMIPAPLLAVIAGVVIDRIALQGSFLSPLTSDQRITLPGLEGPADFFSQLHLPDFAMLFNPQVYMMALTIALVASLETLLSLEAADKIDPFKRHSPPHRELKAQGVGNLCSGLVGGLPITAVIVRSSANVQAGARTRFSSFVHGILLLASVTFFAVALELIPFACLAAILLHTGYKLARPALFIAHYRQGWNRFLPYVITIVAIMLTDLLKGVIVGLLCSLYFLVRSSFRSAISFTKHGRHCLLRIHKDVSFLNREEMRGYLDAVPDDSFVIIDATEANFIDPDIQEDINNFIQASKQSNVTVELKSVDGLSATFPGVSPSPRFA
ncbi:SulP family inorganic anion transporter [Phytohalomonas tamaricis]|uniref:SulP family inorganic anion transporter n=1 Tax=Phytohalomonas tamaricis TaxID=2081032 RepID=UPI000D0B8BB5|nr:SulP family inorganic anion transporter [Phytohalomonas tamaricis]